jgi:WD40 repeat protein
MSAMTQSLLLANKFPVCLASLAVVLLSGCRGREVGGQTRRQVAGQMKLLHSFGVRESGFFYGAAFSKSGKQALSIIDVTVQLWDLKSGKEITRRSFDPNYRVLAVGFSDRGPVALTQCGLLSGPLKAWDVKSGELLRDFREVPSCAVFSPDGNHVLAGCGRFDNQVTLKDCRLLLWNLASGKELARVSEAKDHILEVAFVGGEKRVATFDIRSRVRLWDVERGQEVRSFVGSGGWPEAAEPVFSGDGRRVFINHQGPAGGTGEFILWDVESGKSIHRFSARDYAGKHEGDPAVGSKRFLPNGQRALFGVRTLKLERFKETPRERAGQTGGHDVGWKFKFVSFNLVLCDLRNGRELQRSEDLSQDRNCLAVSPDGRQALVGRSGALEVWELPP